MKYQKIHQIIDWCIIAIFLFFIVTTMTTAALRIQFTYIAPLGLFIALCLLFLNQISLKDCFYKKDVEFYLLCFGIFLAGVNIMLIGSNLGAFFTIADFLLILYLANKIHLDNIQLGTIAFSCILVLFYWLFINKETYDNSISNPNVASLIIFTSFCVCISFLVYCLSSFSLSKWTYHIAILIIFYIVTKRILSLHCRGVLLAIIAWAGTYYILPKKKFTISLILGFSLLMPVVYVLLWKSGLVDGVTVLGKKFASGRDIIWYEFFKVFIHHPITGIGSNFDVMIPDLYLKEVHHGLLDLLFVHGIPVFLIVLYFMYKRISEVITSSFDSIKGICLASIYGLIVSGSFENHYIVSPYNILLMTIFMISHHAESNKQKSE